MTDEAKSKTATATNKSQGWLRRDSIEDSFS
jgi:hypothetical protein